MNASGSERRGARILLVEDDPGDQELTRRAVKEDSAAGVELQIVASGDEALDYLFQRGAWQDRASAPRPDLVLLDLNLPGAPGKKVLEAAKTDPVLRHTPIVVLTTSARPSDIRDCYALGANAYVVKPLDALHFFEVFRSIHHFWLEVATLPER